MKRKAQAEFALILGLLVIASVVGIYAFSSLNPPVVDPTAMSDDQRSVVSYTNNFVREAAVHTIHELYSNGGYLDSSTRPLGSVEVRGFGNVAYWQMCENHNAPDLRAEFNKGVLEYIEENLPERQSFAGRQASFGKSGATVDTTIYGNKLKVTVNMPVTFEGLMLSRQHTVEVPTKIGRVYDFASNFARLQAEGRLLDNHLLLSLMQSSEYSDVCFIPFGTGSVWMRHSFTWEQLKDCMERHVRYSLTNTQIGREIPLDDEEKLADFKYRGWDGTALEFFFVEGVPTYDPLTGIITGGDRYEDLEIQFIFGDKDGLDSSEFSAPELLELKPETGSFQYFVSGIPLSQYAQTYSVKYPVIVTVWDESAGDAFNFATYVYMKDNGIGTGCTAPPELPEQEGPSYNEYCLSGELDYADIVVVYENTNEPVVGARVSFAGCFIGTTDATGVVSKQISRNPSLALGDLTVEVGDKSFSECHTYDTLRSGVRLEVPKSSTFDVNFMKVRITKGGDGSYTLNAPTTPAQTDWIAVEMIRQTNVCDYANAVYSFMNIDTSGNIVSEVDAGSVPVTDYDVAVSTQSGEEILGYLNATGFRPAGSEIYVYAPSMAGFEDSSDMYAEIENIRALYAACGIMGPVSSVPYSISGSCKWTPTS